LSESWRALDAMKKLSVVATPSMGSRDRTRHEDLPHLELRLSMGEYLARGPATSMLRWSRAPSLAPGDGGMVVVRVAGFGRRSDNKRPGRLASAAVIAFVASLVGGTCQRAQTTITVTPTLANPGTLQVAGQGFIGANFNGHCARLALFGLGPPGLAIGSIRAQVPELTRGVTRSPAHDEQRSGVGGGAVRSRGAG
jgi:hypothetical protein